MKEHPILFSAPMVRATLDGSKTQTRRSCKIPAEAREVKYWAPPSGRSQPGWADPGVNYWTERGNHIDLCPYGQPGDQLLVAMEIPSSPNRDYCAGSDGQIYSRTRYAGFGRKERTDWYPLVGHIDKRKGYHRVSLCHENKKVTRSIHSLVCEAFYGAPPFKGTQVRHLDGNQDNNAPFNLAWGTQSQNWADRRDQGHGIEGEKHHAAKLTDMDRTHVRWAVERGLCSQRHAARVLGMAQGSICKIMNACELRETVVDIPEYRVPRILLEIVSVRVERLQDISEADAIAEGIDRVQSNFGNGPAYCDYRMADIDDTAEWFSSPIASYRSLWESINGPGSWEANPFVWVVEFKRVPDTTSKESK